MMHDLAHELVRQGASVLVVTADEHLDVPSQLSMDDDVQVLRVRCRSFQSESASRRAIAEIKMVYDTWRLGKKNFRTNPQDLVVWWAPSLFYPYLVSKLKRLWKAPAYLILRDFVPKWWVDCGILKRESFMFRAFRAVEVWQYRLANTVAIQSPANQRYFEEEKLPWVNTEVLWNWSNAEGEEFPKTDVRKSLALQEKVVFFGGGNIGKAQDMDNILRLATSLQSETSVHFLFVGDGTEVARIQDIVQEADLKNFTLLPAVDQKTYMGMLSEFDVGIIALDRNHSTQNFPGKMLNYMYFGLPCLASINPGNDLKEMLESRDAGLVSIAGDDPLLLANALRLIRDPKLRKQLGKNGQITLTEIFSVRSAASQILTHATNAIEVGNQ